MSLIFQYFSDLHLEFGKPVPKIFPLTEGYKTTNDKFVCVLAGDIGSPFQDNYWQLLQQVNSSFDYTLIVLGNHEFYGSSYGETIDKVQSEIKAKGLVNTFLLNDKSLIIDDCLIMGTTLWSDIPPSVQAVIQEKMNDYKHIKNFSIDFQNHLHKCAVNFLKQSYSYYKTANKFKKCVIISHHAPMFKGTSDPKFDESISTFAFGTDLPDLIDLCDVWIYGHTHYNSKSHPKLKSNQLGYSDSPLPGFDPKACFSL